jgi:hypothetical protein
MVSATSPFAIPNIRLFIAFRIFFNARFYYPVFTILFLDFGLSIEQCADILGRRYLIVATSLLMVVELSVIAFVPLGNTTFIFWAFLINRILSGLAEAMASGADEAIAYDALVANGREDDWPKVLSVQMRLRSIASIVTMTFGALIYDPSVVNRILAWFGSSQSLGQQVTMRFPIYLTLVLAILATITAFKMEEDDRNKGEDGDFKAMAALKMTWQAGCWIARTPFALSVILFGMCFDHVLRMIVTMTSQYYRLIELPEASFGVIGSAIGLLGLLTPKLAEHMAENYSATTNMYSVSAITILGLAGLTTFIPYWGLLPMGLIFVALMLVSFFTSHYLNQITESHQRATVLSFKGLAFNLAYGLIGFFFALLITHLRASESSLHSDWLPGAVEGAAFRGAIGWFPWYTLVCLAATGFYCWYRLKQGNRRA